jgi:zinc protease
VKQRIVIVDKPGAPQTALAAFGVGVPRNTPDYAAIDVMNNILGGLFSSRINMNLRERNGYTYGAFSFYEFHRGAGPFIAGALVRTDVTGPAAQELIKELNTINTDPPNASEVNLAKNFSLQSLSGLFETDSFTSMLMGDLFIYNLPVDYYRSLPRQYDSLTSADIAAAARKQVHPEQMVIVAVGDRAKIQSGLEKLGFGPIEFRDSFGNLLNQPN